MRTRNQVLEMVSHKEFDLVVVGAGIVGAGIAQDAASRGLSVLVIDKDDFAAGTSSRTTKIIHGGLRYLERLQVRLTYALCQERALLEHLAPHLVRDLTFVLPLIKGQWLMDLKSSLGLTLYDLLSFAGGGGPAHKRLNRKEVLESAPALAHNNISGGLRFHDALTDDARLVLEVIKSACANGALALNYLAAIGFSTEQGKIRKINCRDRYSGQNIVINCKACINASGVWSDQVAQLMDKGWTKRVLPSKGVHIVLPQSGFETNSALFLPAFDQRYIFVIPWQRALIVGPTDSAYSKDLNSPMADGDEVDYLLNVVNSYSGERQINRSDVIATWAGLRPLAGPADANVMRALTSTQLVSDTAPTLDNDSSSIQPEAQSINTATSKISREHEIFDGPGAMVCVIGGKLTNYRMIASQVIDHVIKKFTELSFPQTKISRTKRIMLGGWLDKQDFLTQTAAISTRARKLLLEPATIDHLITNYGRDAQFVLDVLEKDSCLGERICPDFPPILAEIDHCALREMAVSLEDLLSRRIRLTQLHQKQALDAAPKVAKLMQKSLGWDDARISAELAALEHTVGRLPAPAKAALS